MKVKAILGLLLVSCLSAAAHAEDFIWPPELWAPEWETPAPYQRNIMWDFDKDPTVLPPLDWTWNDPAYDVHYEGTDDPVLWASDEVWFEGPVQWFENLGMIGIDNTGGTSEVVGTAYFLIDNWRIVRPLKHVWTEVISVQPLDQSGGFGDYVVPGLGVPVDDPPGVEYTGGNNYWFDFGEFPPRLLENDWYWIEPNPPWEVYWVDIYAPAGEAVYVDSVHIATECIPEPATMAFLALGSVPMLLRARKRRTYNAYR